MSKYSDYMTYLKVKYFKIGSVQINEISTDGTMAGNSDLCVPTEKAVKTYADSLAGTLNAMVYKGVLACAGNPNYPAANAGEAYIVSTAGKVGGSSGVVVQVGDLIICNTDATSSGDEATVGTKWNIIQSHSGSLYTAETSATDNTILRYDGTTGTLIQKSLASIDDSGSINIPSGQTYKINTVALAYGDVGAAAVGHNHSGTYLAIAATAADSSKLETHSASYFAVSGHNHSGTYIPVIAGAATGDIMYYSGSAWVALGAGASGEVLTMSAGGLPEWS